MVTGYNVDIKHGGKVYHVQTEDRGRKVPVIETLIYLGGTIIHQVKYNYEDRNSDDKYKEAEIKILLDQQHERLIDEVRHDRFDPDRKPFGEEFITDRSLDECILDFLVEQAATHTLSLSVVSQTGFVPGEAGTLVVRATHHDSGAPIPGVAIRSRLIFSSSTPTPLPELTTDDDGVASLQFKVPQDEGVKTAIIVQAESPFGTEQMQRSVC